jgi:uncharacterized protein YigA (DUF484 family)
MNENDIVDYLKIHPEFFNEHAELLAGISLSNPHGGAAVSLGERQVGILRDKQRLLETKMAELLRFGEENDAIGEKVHRLGVGLIASRDFASVVHIIYSQLGIDFAVPHVALRVWGVGGGSDPEFSPVSDSVKRMAENLASPYCGFGANEESLQWFGERQGHIRSMAQISLRSNGTCVGLLVLASEEAERFYPDMGVLYLDRIGEMTSAVLQRVLG